MYTSRKESKRRGKRSAGYDVKKFLNDIKRDLGNEKFSDFLALQGEVTLIFALDVTGSMHDEIQASKEMIKKISQYDRSEPVDYILTTFSDPVGRFMFNIFCTNFVAFFPYFPLIIFDLSVAFFSSCQLFLKFL